MRLVHITSAPHILVLYMYATLTVNGVLTDFLQQARLITNCNQSCVAGLREIRIHKINILCFKLMHSSCLICPLKLASEALLPVHPCYMASHCIRQQCYYYCILLCHKDTICYILFQVFLSLKISCRWLKLS